VPASCVDRHQTALIDTRHALRIEWYIVVLIATSAIS
jgi:hypothetical protein